MVLDLIIIASGQSIFHYSEAVGCSSSSDVGLVETMGGAFAATRPPRQSARRRHWPLREVLQPSTEPRMEQHPQ